MNLVENSRPGRWHVWWLAIRPRTLPASASGVVMGGALAWAAGAFHLFPTLAALFIALLLQIASNVANDVYDFERGADTQDRQGPVRVTQAGWLRPRDMKLALWVIFAAAMLIGLYLAFLRGWLIVILGLAAMISAVAYTSGPFPLAYYGLGDVFVFVFFGLVAVAGTYFVNTGFFSGAALLMSIPIGLMVTDILVVNNLRDIGNDRAAGKRTLAVRLGERGSRVQYVTFMVIAYALVPLLIWQRIIPLSALLVMLSSPLAWRSTRTVLTESGRPLNKALAGTGQAALAYSMLFFLAVIL
jgi:1,4-dihydroxy-2-naphthoate polyprenyltransferase